ncbi:MAG: hypothetical protein ACLSA6_11110 [Holdemania massiliensis]
MLELEDDEFRITSLTPQVVVDRPQGPLSPELKRSLNEAQLTLDLIDQRNLTLQLVFRCLVRYQQNHLMKGAPLAICRLKDIAEDTGLHISTVSRACAHKYFEYQAYPPGIRSPMQIHSSCQLFRDRTSSAYLDSR